MTIKASDLLKYDITPFLFGVLYSRIMPKPTDDSNPKHFYVYTAFRTSKAVLKTAFSLSKYASRLVQQYNSLSGYPNWEIHKSSDNAIDLRLYIQNDLNIDAAQFYNLVYKKLRSSTWLNTATINEDKKYFLRGYMESRGSVDTSLKLFAQDYFYNNRFELKRVQLLTDDIGLPISYANFNPRNMQPQFVSGENKRNAQFRINLFYYAKEIGFINEYKALIFEKAYKPRARIARDGIIYFQISVPNLNSHVAFIKYINFFTNNIYDKVLTPEKVGILRKQIGFNTSQELGQPYRNKSIVDLFDELSEDKCALCGTSQTFKKKANGRQSFEIHHMIPFHNGQEFDNIANFVKLCPTCHRSLKRGSASKDDQIRSIITILGRHPEVFEYTSSALGIEELPKLAEEIWSLLG
ncbi:MAG: HNH endonuclease [Acholeplasmataceae bacterium]|nr:HNH endonuclease [Acholeplasmataceae bacterium]